MFGNPSWGCEASPPGTSSRAPCTPKGQQAARSRHRSPSLPQPRGGRASCHRRLRGARPRAPGGARGAGSRARTSLLEPAGRPGVSAAETADPRGRALGTAKEKATEALPTWGCAELGPAGLQTNAPGPRGPSGLPAEPLGAPPRGSRDREPNSCDGGNSCFANRAQPLRGKVPAVAAGGGHILTFSTRRPERERGGEK